jgi:hypothetical protein
MCFAKRLVGLLMALALCGPAIAEAQSIWLPRTSEPTIAIEGLKPFFDGGGSSFFSTAWFLSGRVRVSNSVVLVGEVPFAFGKLDNEFVETDSDAAIGNIYFGAEFGSRSSPVFFELGARAPLAPDDNVASVVGTFADLDRWEAFIPNLLPISGMVNYMNVSETGLLLRFRGGPLLWIPTESGGETELLGLLDAQVGYEDPMGKFGVKGGLTSRIVVTESGSFSDRTSFQGGVNAWFSLGRVRPGVFVLVPLDGELRDIVNVTVGLNAQILLN